MNKLNLVRKQHVSLDIYRSILIWDKKEREIDRKREREGVMRDRDREEKKEKEEKKEREEESDREKGE